jgi:hypothetical protein
MSNGGMACFNFPEDEKEESCFINKMESRRETNDL